MSFIVGIDGPAGSGKGTVTKIIANKLGLTNIDTGITYRCVALKCLNNGIKLEEKDKIINVANNLKLTIDNTKDGESENTNETNSTTNGTSTSNSSSKENSSNSTTNNTTSYLPQTGTK